MKQFDELEKAELRDLLVRNWMTHDAMWFANCLRHCGIDKTNQVNTASTRAMAAIEATRLKSCSASTESRADDLERYRASLRDRARAFHAVRAELSATEPDGLERAHLLRLRRHD
jgi:hypothetical protein